MITLLNKLKQNKENWDLFSKAEEYSPKKLDCHNRFTYSYSNYVNILEPSVSKFLVENGMKVEYPDGQKFAVCLTHDVDDIYPPLSHTILSSAWCIKNFNFNELRHQVFWRFNRNEKSPYCNFKDIIKLEEKYNAKSSFFFIAADRDVKRFRYNIEDMENELKYIVDMGWEVGLHGGYYAYNNLDNIKKEKLRLEKVLDHKIIGFRNHYLRFKVPNTWELLAKAGFKYDTTFGYNDQIGFRNGMCHPFRPYNLYTDKEIDIFEVPLTIMDSALFNSTKSFDKAWGRAKRLIDTVEEYGGVITLLWHNFVFDYQFRKNWASIYDKILNYCYEKNAWMTSGEDIYRWWNDHVNSNYRR